MGLKEQHMQGVHILNALQFQTLSLKFRRLTPKQWTDIVGHTLLKVEMELMVQKVKDLSMPRNQTLGISEFMRYQVPLNSRLVDSVLQLSNYHVEALLLLKTKMVQSNQYDINGLPQGKNGTDFFGSTNILILFCLLI